MSHPLFVVLFEDNPGHADTRARHMEAHLHFLDAHPEIEGAGPLLDCETVAGGLWLVAAPDAASVGRLVEADPFWPTGLRRSVRIRRWHRVHAGRERL